MPTRTTKKAGPRCKHVRADGKRCTLPRAKDHPALCVYHWRREQELDLSQNPEAQSLAARLLGSHDDFKTAASVNQVLGKLFVLLARKQIARRDAAILTYIAQLLLQSLYRVKDETTGSLGYPAWKQIVADAVLRELPKTPKLKRDSRPGATY